MEFRRQAADHFLKIGGDTCEIEGKVIKCIGGIGLQARAGSSENPQTRPASPARNIPFGCQRSRASNQMGAAAIAGTFDGESFAVLMQRQLISVRSHLVTHRCSSGAGYVKSVACCNKRAPFFWNFLREVREG